MVLPNERFKSFGLLNKDIIRITEQLKNMADTGIFCTGTEVGYKAGYGASATALAEAYTNSFISQAESYINARTLINWSDAYSGLNVDLKGILKDAASSLAAIYVINYDTRGLASRQEALIRINVLWARVEECCKLLEKEANRNFVKTGVEAT